jgi:hypothetical protein
MNETQNLTGRKARCPQCRTVKDSNLDLPFLEFRGIGSKAALNQCKNCGFYKVAHKPETRKGNNLICAHFEPKGAFEFDSFYCGCRGWD